MTEFFNRRDQKAKRQELRREAPPAEEVLWALLRRRAVGGARFRHQHSVGPFVVDFYCPAHKLALEIDGPTHDGGEAHEYDAERQRFIETADIRFLRFTNARIYNDLDAVVAEIARVVAESSPPCKENEADGNESQCRGEEHSVL